MVNFLNYDSDFSLFYSNYDNTVPLCTECVSMSGDFIHLNFIFCGDALAVLGDVTFWGTSKKKISL